jgi:hypothetical protein
MTGNSTKDPLKSNNAGWHLHFWIADMWYRSECIGRKIKMLFDEVKNNELYSESANLVVCRYPHIRVNAQEGIRN